MSATSLPAPLEPGGTLAVPDGNDQHADIFPHERRLASTSPFVELTSSEKKNTRAHLTAFLLACEQHRGIIHYSQHRPFRVQVEPARGFTGDCSALPTQAFYWAQDRLDGPPLEDPNGQNFSGYGFTGTLLAANHHRSIPEGRYYWVGDCCIFGTFWETRHVIICRKSGHAADAIWTSHGSELGPLPVKIGYRQDKLGVYRPASLA